jgi:arsenate reductase
MMLFICYPKCTTCQRARKWLDGRNVPYEFRDIKLNNPTYEELKRLLAASGLPIKRFFNTSGLLYKSLNLKEKLPSMTDEECLNLLATDGMLVKRPIVVDGGLVLVGFRADEWERRIADES